MKILSDGTMKPIVCLKYIEHTLWGDNLFEIYLTQKDWDSIKNKKGKTDG